MLIPDGGIKEARSWLPCTGERKSPRESEHPLTVAALLLFRALPDHAWKTFQRHQRLAGIGPFLQFLDRDVIERLPAGAAGKQRARDVHHVRRPRALVNQRRATTRAKATHGFRRLVFEARNSRVAFDN